MSSMRRWRDLCAENSHLVRIHWDGPKTSLVVSLEPRILVFWIMFPLRDQVRVLQQSRLSDPNLAKLAYLSISKRDHVSAEA